MIKLAETEKEIEEALSIRYEVQFKPQGYDRKDIEKFDPQGKPVTLVCIIKNKTVASLTAFLVSDVESELIHLAVIPKYQRIGIGKELVKVLESELKRVGIKRNTVRARASLTKFYSDLGYTAVGPIQEYPGFKEKGIVHQKMVKDL